MSPIPLGLHGGGHQSGRHRRPAPTAPRPTHPVHPANVPFSHLLPFSAPSFVSPYVFSSVSPNSPATTHFPISLSLLLSPQSRALSPPPTPPQTEWWPATVIDVRERDPTSGLVVNQHKLTYVGWDNHHDRWVNPHEVRRTSNERGRRELPQRDYGVVRLRTSAPTNMCACGRT